MTLLPRAKKVGLAVLGILVAVTASELVLRALAALYGQTAPVDTPTPSSVPVILCLGDSHTYGVLVGTNSYPALLERELRDRGRDSHVVNLGAPGMNTSEIRRMLPDALHKFRPHVVILLASVNNGWNIRDTTRSDIEDGLPISVTRRAVVWLQTHSRVARSLSLASHHLRPGKPQERVVDGQGKPLRHETHAEWRVDSRRRAIMIEGMHRAVRDIAAIVAGIRKAGAMPVLMTYVAPTDDNFSDQNLCLRHMAKTMQVPLLDNDRIMRPLFTRPDGSIDPAMHQRVFMKDLHLEAYGYELIAEHLAQLLEDTGSLRGSEATAGAPGGT